MDSRRNFLWFKQRDGTQGMEAFLSCDPAVAEAVAVLWEVQIAKSEMFNSIIMERDANACFDTLNGKLDDGN